MEKEILAKLEELNQNVLKLIEEMKNHRIVVVNNPPSVAPYIPPVSPWNPPQPTYPWITYTCSMENPPQAKFVTLNDRVPDCAAVHWPQ